MSKHVIPSITGLAFALALPLAAGSPHPVLALRSLEQAPKPVQVHVATPRAVRGQRRLRPAVRAKAPKAQHPINLNTATVTELMQLPRVGMGTAERIVAFRKEHGGFKRIEEVMNVKGVGEKSFAKLKPFLIVSAPAK